MFSSIFGQSKGLKRSLGILFLLAGNVADAIPVLAPWKSVLETLGAVLGITGVAHAVLK